MIRIILFLIIVTVQCVSAFAQKGNVSLSPPVYHQHFVFFGDSWTDTGNYPEPSSLSNPVLKNFNLYVPLSNPVPSSLYGKGMVPDPHFLAQAIPYQGLINGSKRELYSINWPLYLVFRLDPESVLLSWINYYLHPEERADNVNYAWASAIAEGNKPACFHDDGTLYPGECMAQSIISQRRVYKEHTAVNPDYDQQHGYKYEDLEIPNLAKQVSLYLADKRIRVQDGTSFFIYIGGNDIGNYLKSQLAKVALLPASIFDKMADKKMTAVAESVAYAAQRIEEAYQKTSFGYRIYVLTLPLISNLHEGYSYSHVPLVGGKIKRALDYVVTEYNKVLEKVFEHDASVQVIDSGDMLNQLARTSNYNNAIAKGLTCIDDPSNTYIRPDIQENMNCNYADSRGKGTYFSWNNAHFVSQVNQKLALFVMGMMNR